MTIDVRHILDSSLPAMAAKTALVYQDWTYTYQDLSDEVSRLACGLLQTATPGDLLAIWLPNCPEILCIFLACLKAGIVPMPFHQGMTWSEVHHILVATQAKNLITSRKILDEWPVEFATTSLHQIYVIESDQQSAPFRTYHELTNTRRDFIAPCLSEDSPGFVLHTSGSEGYAKGVVLSYRNLNHILHFRLNHTKLTPESTAVVASCLTQSVGLHQSLALLAAGGRIVLLESYDLEPLVAAVDQYQPTHLMMTVNPFDRLLHHPAISESSFQNVLFASVGADRVTPRVQNRFIALTGKPLAVSYGLTESSWALVNFEGRLDKCLALGKPGPDIQIKLVDSQGIEVPTGEVGEIYIKSPRTMVGYLNNAPLTQAAFVDGWLASGDLAYQDNEGYFWFAGRKKNIIVLSTGDNVSPGEVEQAILSHSAVLGCVVISAQSKDTSEVPWAFVTRSDETLTELALETFLKERISAFKIPRKIIFVSELPVGLTGKIRYPETSFKLQ
ncbi:MAG: acyl--CoA ligase [Acidobacteria bacterium]|nr:acyl--CoA ligase [Acidobacteriota bacterium]